jgi:hypothetical protein
MLEVASVPCKWCGKSTPMIYTKECEQHWELRQRIEAEPDMAARILDHIKSEVKDGPKT